MTRWEQYYQERERDEALNQIKHRIRHRKVRWAYLNHKKQPSGQVYLVMQNPTSSTTEMSVDITDMLNNQDKYDDIAEFAIKQLEQQGADNYRPTSPF